MYSVHTDRSKEKSDSSNSFPDIQNTTKAIIIIIGSSSIGKTIEEAIQYTYTGPLIDLTQQFTTSHGYISGRAKWGITLNDTTSIFVSLYSTTH
jgi:hypothetical protein